MPQKYIILNDKLVMGDVQFHSQLSADSKAIKGGGFWHIDPETKCVILYGSSIDFGPCKVEDVMNAEKPFGMELPIVFTSLWPLSVAMDHVRAMVKSNKKQPAI